MKSNQAPDIKVLRNRRASNKQIAASYARAMRAKGPNWPDRLKPNDEQGNVS